MDRRGSSGSSDRPEHGDGLSLTDALTFLDARLHGIAERQRELALRALELEHARETLRRELIEAGSAAEPTLERHTVVPLVSPVPRPQVNPYWSQDCWLDGHPTVAQAVVEVLRRNGGEVMSTISIRKAIVEAGWAPGSKNLNALLNATLARLDKTPDCPIKRLHKGRYFYEEA